MKKILVLAVCAIAYFQVSAVGVHRLSDQLKDNDSKALITPGLEKMSAENFANLTPEKYQELTGKKLGFFKKMQLKAAQKALKKQSHAGGGEIPKGLYIVLAILGLAWIGMGVMDDWSGDTWIINLVLTVLFWLPGFIHALIVMKKYY